MSKGFLSGATVGGGSTPPTSPPTSIPPSTPPTVTAPPPASGWRGRAADWMNASQRPRWAWKLAENWEVVPPGSVPAGKPKDPKTERRHAFFWAFVKAFLIVLTVGSVASGISGLVTILFTGSHRLPSRGFFLPGGSLASVWWIIGLAVIAVCVTFALVALVGSKLSRMVKLLVGALAAFLFLVAPYALPEWNEWPWVANWTGYAILAWLLWRLWKYFRPLPAPALKPVHTKEERSRRNRVVFVAWVIVVAVWSLAFGQSTTLSPATVCGGGTNSVACLQDIRKIPNQVPSIVGTANSACAFVLSHTDAPQSLKTNCQQASDHTIPELQKGFGVQCEIEARLDPSGQCPKVYQEFQKNPHMADVH